LKSCQSWIRKIARQTGTLPTRFILKGVTKEGENAVAGGGFADVYTGMYAGRKVALKVLRVFVKGNRRRIIKVRFLLMQVTC
jgi:predicted unusual protein kinase regulating ubiquinone biosynthesis (AarF/ABC1/UbiB family)